MWNKPKGGTGQGQKAEQRREETIHGGREIERKFMGELTSYEMEETASVGVSQGDRSMG